MIAYCRRTFGESQSPFFGRKMHKAQTLAIHCIDLRFQKMIDDDLKNRSLFGKFDRISWAGSSKDLENVAANASISLRLHDPDEVIIYEHEDCGAYGKDNSQETHKKNAQALADKLEEIKPTLKIETLIATFDGIKLL